MKKNLLVLSLGIFIFSISLVSAQNSCLIINSKNVNDYLNEIPSINSQFSTCVIVIPDAIYSVIGEGNILVTINMDSGSVEQFYATIS